jgi:tetratricopeptide (TPR) repeat protein
MPREPERSKERGGLADTELPEPHDPLARGSGIAATPGNDLAATADASGPHSGGIKRTGTVGRFALVAPLGRGGMGEVHAAYDPDLDRKVALKLLRGGGAGSRAGEARTRLLREARAMARLSHANAITVFEAGQVEVGGEAQVYVAMELIEGGTLGRWLRRKKRGWREILPVIVAAGRGLEAAHAAGMVHRDFKPDNVLVSDRGEVKVTDFGLAALVGLPALDGGEELSGSGPGSGSASSAGGSGPPLDKLTRTGAWVGTPYYMAPEQHRGAAVDARSDQFAFCVTLWEALYRERPFGGRTYEELRRAVDDGAIREPRRDAQVPGWLERALRRGLAVEPARRHGSMSELLALLDRGLRRRRRLLVGGAAGIAVAGTLALAWGMRGGAADERAEPAPCSGAERHLAGAWDDPARAAARAGIEKAQPQLAAEAWPRVERALDRYAGDWVDLHRRACEATRVYGEQTEEQLDVRLRCLDRRRDELAATAQLLAGADGQVAARAVSIAGGLPPVAGCNDAQSLRAGAVLDDAGRLRAAAIERGLAEQIVAFRAGRYAESLAPTKQLLADARALGHRALEAELLLQLAELQMRDRTDAKGSVQSYEAAASAALATGQDRLAARAWAALVYDLSGQERFADADRAGDLARSTLERIGGDPTIESMLDNNLGVSAFDRENYAEAERLLLRAIATRERVLGPDDPRVAAPMDNLASVYAKGGDPTKAMALYEKALRIREQGLGPNHPEVATTLNNLAIDYRKAGRVAEARPMHERAVRIRESALGADHPLVGNALVNLTVDHSVAGEWDACVATGTRTIAQYEKRSRTSFGIGHAAIEAARCQRLAGRPAEGLPLAERALELYRHHGDEAAPNLRRALREHARLLAAAGRRPAAIAALEALMATEDRDLPPDAVERGYTIGELGIQRLAAGQTARGLALLERAVAIWDRDPTPDPLSGRDRLALARLLWDRGDRKRADALAERARIDFTAVDGDAVPGRRDLAAWLAARKP